MDKWSKTASEPRFCIELDFPFGAADLQLLDPDIPEIRQIAIA